MRVGVLAAERDDCFVPRSLLPLLGTDRLRGSPFIGGKVNEAMTGGDSRFPGSVYENERKEKKKKVNVMHHRDKIKKMKKRLLLLHPNISVWPPSSLPLSLSLSLLSLSFHLCFRSHSSSSPPTSRYLFLWIFTLPLFLLILSCDVPVSLESVSWLLLFEIGFALAGCETR